MQLFQSRRIVSPSSSHDPLLKTFRSIHGRIGIFGGSFDPVHNGHIEAARQAMLRHNLDAVVFIPARQNPFKNNAPVCSDSGRLEMLVEALRDQSGFYVSPIELERSGSSYTVDTLKSASSDLGPDSSLFLIVGADCLPEFHKWKDYNDILKLSSLIPVGRPESDGQPIALGAEVPAQVHEARNKAFVPLHIDISSRAIRRAAASGIVNEAEMPAGVCRLIRERKHYTQAA